MKGWVYLGDFNWLVSCYTPQTVIHPCTNRAQCRLTTLIEANALTTTLPSHDEMWRDGSGLPSWTVVSTVGGLLHWSSGKVHRRYRDNVRCRHVARAVSTALHSWHIHDLLPRIHQHRLHTNITFTPECEFKRTRESWGVGVRVTPRHWGGVWWGGWDFLPPNSPAPSACTPGSHTPSK